MCLCVRQLVCVFVCELVSMCVCEVLVCVFVCEVVSVCVNFLLFDVCMLIGILYRNINNVLIRT